MWIVGSLAAVQIIAAGLAMLRRAPADGLVTSARPSLSMESNGGQMLTPVVMPPVAAAVDSAMSTQAEGSLPQFAQEGGTSVGGGAVVSGVVPEPGEFDQPALPPRAESLRGIDPVATVRDTPALAQPSFMGPAVVEEAPSLSQSMVGAQTTVEEIEDPILDRLLAMGAEFRANGNLPKALEHFEQVESSLPNHPRVLAELAASYSQMGMDARADSYWYRILELGPVTSGEFYSIADLQLKKEVAPIVGSTSQQMKIGEVIVESSPPSDEGQRVSLRVVIDGDPAQNPVGEDVSLAVFFYDQVDGERIEASTADSEYLYPTEPYDWKTDGREEITVNYFQPVFTEEQVRELGTRSYYGYAIELYYRDELQDKVTKPDEIAALRLDSAEPPAEPVSTSPGPENALFPAPLTP